MKLSVFQTIFTDYRQLTEEYGLNQMKLIVDTLASKYAHTGITYWTMYSLVNYEFRKDMKGCRINYDAIAKEWDQNVSILELAMKHNVCAYSLLRSILTDFTKSKETTRKWLKEPNLCHDGRLAYEIMQINQHDIMNGFFYNQLSLNSGIAFEKEIFLILKQNKVCFMCEEELRCNNFDVTPDFRLNLPLILVRTNDSMILYRCDDEHIPESLEGEMERLVITWIECKAVFASPECHADYYQTQYYSYINRFGNGLVLYKLGFVRHIRPEHCKNLIIAQQLPLFR